MRNYSAVMLDRAAGALAGQFCGDAFGAQYEFGGPRSELSDVMGPSRVWGTAAGQITDDGELAVALARSIIEREGYDAAAALENYRLWYASRPFDIGMTTSSALGPAAALNHQSQANGALMRLSSLAVYRGAQSDFEAPRHDEDAAADTRLTHPNPVCVFCAVVYSRGIAFALGRGAAAPVTANYMLECAKESKWSDGEIYSILARSRRDRPETIKGADGWAVYALYNALYQLFNAESPKEAIMNTTRLGYDTDTNAAIAGALFGACSGISAFPQDWLDTVQRCDTTKGRHPREYQEAVRNIPALAEKLITA